MSANNQLLIKKRGEQYIIRNIDVDGCGGFDVGEAQTLEEAIKKANAYMGEEEVEYGLNIQV